MIQYWYKPEPDSKNKLRIFALLGCCREKFIIKRVNGTKHEQGVLHTTLHPMDVGCEPYHGTPPGCP